MKTESHATKLHKTETQDFPWGEGLCQAAEAQISHQDPDFASVYSRAVKKPTLKWRSLGLLASAAAVVSLVVGFWPTIFPSAQELAYRETVASLASELLPSTPEPTKVNTAEADWTESLLNPDSGAQEF